MAFEFHNILSTLYLSGAEKHHSFSAYLPWQRLVLKCHTVALLVSLPMFLLVKWPVGGIHCCELFSSRFRNVGSELSLGALLANVS